MGLHDLADPGQPDCVYRFRTPVPTLSAERAPWESEVLARLPQPPCTQLVRVAPFLERILLC